MEAKIIAPIGFRGRILVPQGSEILGLVDSVDRFGFGLKHITARIHYRFYTLQLPDGNAIPIRAELLEVQTAKERVDVDGTARGIHPVASLSSSLGLFTAPLFFLAPSVGVPIWGIKSIVAPSANPEIYFPVGTELFLRLTAPIRIPESAETSAAIASFSPDDITGIQGLLRISAPHARLGKHQSDLINLVFLASRDEMGRAFHAAGWSHAERKSPVSLFRMYQALTRRIGYTRAPMNALTLNGVPSNLVFQKSLDTVQKRHHVRLWTDPHQPGVWLGAAAEDIAFRFQLAHWTHSTAPEIDIERAKVVNDLYFTGCLDAAGLVPRDPPGLLPDPKSARKIFTDSAIAVVRLNSCTEPKTMPGVDAAPVLPRRGRLSRSWASLRTDLRSNILFTTYNTCKLVIDHRALKPLRKAGGAGGDPAGLEWLSPPRTDQ